MGNNKERSIRQSAKADGETGLKDIKSISTPHHLHTANILREWADMAERGELLGVVVGAMDKDMRPKLVTGGILSNRSRDAFWIASLLQKTLLVRTQDEL